MRVEGRADVFNVCGPGDGCVSTRGCQNSWRKAGFQCTIITHRTFANQGKNTFQIIPRIKEHLRKQNDSQTLNVPRTIVH